MTVSSFVSTPSLNRSVEFSQAMGVFDSGVGGLSVLRAIRTLLPGEDLIYVADSAYAPYGDKSADFIEQRTLHIGLWLASQGVSAITIACNTATVVAARHLREATHLPVVAIEPAIKPATQLSPSGRIGVLATRQTVQSESVARLCQTYGQGKQLLLQACPGWVECVESGQLNSPQTQALVRTHLAPLLEQRVDTLVLGCTHYPFLSDLIRQIVGPEVLLIDPAEAVARELARRTGKTPQSSAQVQGRIRVVTSDRQLKIAPVIQNLLNCPIDVEFESALLSDL